MTKRDFELVAAALHRSRMAKALIGNAKERAAALDAIRLVAVDLAATFANVNPRFDRARFLKACGVA